MQKLIYKNSIILSINSENYYTNRPHTIENSNSFRKAPYGGMKFNVSYKILDNTEPETLDNAAAAFFKYFCQELSKMFPEIISIPFTEEQVKILLGYDSYRTKSELRFVAYQVDKDVLIEAKRTVKELDDVKFEHNSENNIDIFKPLSEEILTEFVRIAQEKSMLQSSINPDCKFFVEENIQYSEEDKQYSEQDMEIYCGYTIDDFGFNGKVDFAVEAYKDPHLDLQDAIDLTGLSELHGAYNFF